MHAESNFGRTAPESITVLPELTFDMLEGHPDTSAFGKTHIPVQRLPPLSFDMLAERVTPVLRLTITFRPDATAAQIGSDYHRLFALLNEHDLANGGRGLQPVDVECDTTLITGDVQFAFRPNEPIQAAERLKRMIESLDKLAEQLPTIGRCGARVLQVAV